MTTANWETAMYIGIGALILILIILYLMGYIG